MTAIVRATFFGTSSILLTDGTSTVMTDAYFSRPSLLRIRFGRVAPDLTRIADTLDRAGIDVLDAILVAHSHVDHAMDAPEVARRTGATVYGSESTRNIGRGWGLDERRMQVIAHGDEIVVGEFRVRVFEGLHSPGDFSPGTIDAPLTPPCSAKDYRTGECYSFLVTHSQGTILIHPSANHVPHAFDDLDVDALYLGIGGLGSQPEQFQDEYWRHVVDATGPSLIVPVHWDNFGRPLTRPLRPLPRVIDNVAAARELVRHKAGDAITVRWQEPFETIEPLTR